MQQHAAAPCRPGDAAAVAVPMAANAQSCINAPASEGLLDIAGYAGASTVAERCMQNSDAMLSAIACTPAHLVLIATAAGNCVCMQPLLKVKQSNGSSNKQPLQRNGLAPPPANAEHLVLLVLDRIRLSGGQITLGSCGGSGVQRVAKAPAHIGSC